MWMGFGFFLDAIAPTCYVRCRMFQLEANAALDCVFSAGGFLCFCRGFWGKRVVERGFLMVNLWWDCGDFVVN
jgi:hypothetical protein